MGAAFDCCSSSPGVELVAMADIFPDKLAASKGQLKELGDKFKVDDNHCFTGFNAYQYLLMSGVDMVLLTTCPGFRPLHARAAVEAGKHVFTEKPIATCPTGVRSVIESANMAQAKGLGWLAGTQYRHHRGYEEIIQRVHKGDIGKLITANAYYVAGAPWYRAREANWSDMEWQIRSWLWFTWLSGDQPAEQFVHNIDVMNWLNGGPPTKARGMGGRQQRSEKNYGNVYDHYAMEFDYPNGVKVHATCRWWDGCYSRVTNQFIGSEGTAGTDGLNDPCGFVNGDKVSGAVNPYQQEHADFIASIRAGKPINEGRQVAESTLTAIMGRMATYTGLEVTWEQALNSKLNLQRDHMEFAEFGCEAIPTPGKTPLI